MLNKTLSILLIENDEQRINALSNALVEVHKNKYRITSCTTLKHAIKNLEKNGFDIILTSTCLSEASGKEIFVPLLDKFSLPIVIITDDEYDGISTLAVEEGVQDYIDINNLSKADLGNIITHAILRNNIHQSVCNANRVKTEFLTNMSHELRTPLNGIMGAVDLLRRAETPVERQRYMDIIEGSGETLLHLINSILDISKIESGQLELCLEPVNIRKIIRDVNHTVIQSANKNNTELYISYNSDIPDIIEADNLKLRQVFINLLGNAVKFVQNGHIITHIEEKSRTKDKTTLLFTIEDTGIGIPEEKMEKIFDKFFQADSSSTKGYGGTGLGLSITRQLIYMMNGDIGIESKVGFGTKIWFEITVPYEHHKENEFECAQKHIRNTRALIVDDSPLFRKMMGNMLDNLGVHYQTANSAREGLKCLAKAAMAGKDFDIVLTDFNMPKINGIQFAQKIREDSRFEDHKIILVTSLGKLQREEQQPAQQIHSELFSETLMKPIDDKTLAIKISNCIQNSNLRDSEIENSDRKLFFDPLHANILLVEDQLVNRLVITDMLEELGCEVEVAENGQQAVEKISESQNKYDIILMDCMMPVMDGFAATKKLRNLESLNIIDKQSVIAVTANAMVGEKEQCLAAGMDGYIAKPVKEEVLYSTLVTHLA